LKKIKFILLALVISGCSKTPYKSVKPQSVNDEEIIKALVYESESKYDKALHIYKNLYKNTKDEAFLEKIVESLYRKGEYDKVIELAEKYEQKSFDKKIFEYEIFALIKKKEYKRAKELLKSRFNKKDEFYYTMMAYLLLNEHNLKEAVEYLKSLYALTQKKEVLLQLVDVLIKLKKYNEAFAYLRTHLDTYGCDIEICKRLALIYKQLFDYDNLVNIYEKMGELDSKYLVLAVKTYVQKGDYDKAISLVKKYNLGEGFLLDLYILKKDYRKAAFTALKIYEKTLDPKYLFEYCEYLYFDHPSKEEIKDLVNKLEYLKTLYPSAYIYNFLAYVLIDKDIDYKKGLKYAQKAVELNPQEEEYIDTLAWGYYKLGNCKEAWEIIKFVKSKDKEILKHKEAIKKCLKEKHDSSKDNRQN